MAAATQQTQGPTPDRNDIQGNLVGFNKDHQLLVFVSFPDTTSGKSFLHAIEPDIATASEVRRFNALYKKITARGAARGTIEATWLNVALSASGLATIGAPGMESFPAEFSQTMAAQSQAIGDVESSGPSTAGALYPRRRCGACPHHSCGRFCR